MALDERAPLRPVRPLELPTAPVVAEDRVADTLEARLQRVGIRVAGRRGRLQPREFGARQDAVAIRVTVGDEPKRRADGALAPVRHSRETA